MTKLGRCWLIFMLAMCPGSQLTAYSNYHLFMRVTRWLSGLLGWIFICTVALERERERERWGGGEGNLTYIQIHLSLRHRAKGERSGNSDLRFITESRRKRDRPRAVSAFSDRLSGKFFFICHLGLGALRYCAMHSWYGPPFLNEKCLSMFRRKISVPNMTKK